MEIVVRVSGKKWDQRFFQESQKLEFGNSCLGFRKIGASVHACNSYTAEEIVWGAKFSKNVDKAATNMEGLINQYRMVETPQMSAKEMAQQGLIDL